MVSTPADAGKCGVNVGVELSSRGDSELTHRRKPKKASVKAAVSIQRSYRQIESDCEMAESRSASTEGVMDLCGEDARAARIRHMPRLASCSMGLWSVGSLSPAWRCIELTADKYTEMADRARE